MRLTNANPAVGVGGARQEFLGQQPASNSQTTPEKQATDGRPDPRLVFLERASARLILVEAGVLELEEAIGGLVAAFRSLISRSART
jgi:hypothetical protein